MASTTHLNLKIREGISSSIRPGNLFSNCPRNMLLLQALSMSMKSEHGTQIWKGIHLKWFGMKCQTFLYRFFLKRSIGGGLYLCLCWVWIRDQLELLEWLLLYRDIASMSSSTKFIAAFETTNLHWEEQREEYFWRRSYILLTFLVWTTNPSTQVFFMNKKDDAWSISRISQYFKRFMARIPRKNCLRFWPNECHQWLIAFWSCYWIGVVQKQRHFDQAVSMVQLESMLRRILAGISHFENACKIWIQRQCSSIGRGWRTTWGHDVYCSGSKNSARIKTKSEGRWKHFEDYGENEKKLDPR